MTGRCAISATATVSWYSRLRAWILFRGRRKECARYVAQGCAGILCDFLTEELARELGDFLKRFDETPYPVVLVIPSKNGSTGFGAEEIRRASERALGVDLFSND